MGMRTFLISLSLASFRMLAVAAPSPQVQYAKLPVTDAVSAYVANPLTEEAALDRHLRLPEEQYLKAALKASARGDFQLAKDRIAKCIDGTKSDNDRFVKTGSVCWKLLLDNELVQGNEKRWIEAAIEYKEFVNSRILENIIPKYKVVVGELGVVDLPQVLRDMKLAENVLKPLGLTPLAIPNHDKSLGPVFIAKFSDDIAKIDFVLDTGANVSTVVPVASSLMEQNLRRFDTPFWNINSFEASGNTATTIAAASKVQVHNRDIGPTLFLTGQNMRSNTIGLNAIYRLGRVKFTGSSIEFGEDYESRKCNQPMYFVGNLLGGRTPAMVIAVDGKPQLAKIDTGMNIALRDYRSSPASNDTMHKIQTAVGDSASRGVWEERKVNGKKVNAFVLNEATNVAAIPVLGTGILQGFDLELDFVNRTACLFERK